MGFVDAALEGFGSTRAAALLERLDAATPWSKLAGCRGYAKQNHDGPPNIPWLRSA
jgi:hypothetical protein